MNIKGDMPNLSYLNTGEKVIYLFMIITISPIFLPDVILSDPEDAKIM